MEEKILENHSSSLDIVRGLIPGSGLNFLDAIRIFHGEEKLKEISKSVESLRLISDSYSLMPPPFIYLFLQKIIQLTCPKSVYDPWLSIASPAIILSLKNVVGVCRFQNEATRIVGLFPDYKDSISIGDIVNQPIEINRKYDLICSFPPLGMKEPRIDKSKQTFDYSANLIIKCAQLLADEGIMIYLLSPSFFYQDKTKELLKQNGLFVDAIFSIPSGIFYPQTRIASNIVVIKKKNSDGTFLAELTTDDATNSVVLENYKNRKVGKILQLGGFADIMTFKTLNSLILEREFNEQVKRLGYPAIALTNIALEIKLLKGSNPDEVEHLPNSFYLPKIGNSPAVFNTSSMRIKPQNYFQIQLDETKANANYVANYFNSEIGKKMRLSLEVGTILQIPKNQLEKCMILLPDIAIQSEVIAIEGRIQQLGINLEELKKQLWKQPKKYKTILKELKSINQEEKLENWIDTLPFPISSILWRYYASKEADKKLEHLFHFFEAFSEFLSMIMLSALVQDIEFYKQECHRWKTTDKKFSEWYKSATFGGWNFIIPRISKAVREYLQDKDKMEKCRRIFGNPNDAFINLITNKEIGKILEEVRELRNKWKGHTGITSETEYKRRVITLEQHLNELRKVISDGFEETRIYAPTTSSFEDGLFTYNAKELIGARTPFNEITISSLIPLDRKRLYLAHRDQTKPIELLPFIKYMEESEAVYFYMSIESKNVRWVSYHYEKEAEINQPGDNDLFNALSFLQAD